MNPNAEMSKADRKELKQDLGKTVPENQHCQECGQVKDSVDYCIIQGFKFLCDKCLKEEVKSNVNGRDH